MNGPHGSPPGNGYYSNLGGKYQEAQSKHSKSNQEYNPDILKFEDQNRSTQYLNDGQSVDHGPAYKIGSSHPAVEISSSADPELAHVDGLGVQDSIIMDSTLNKSGIYVEDNRPQDKHHLGHDSLNHMMIKSNVQA